MSPPTRHALATDLDGTLIPLGDDPRQRRDLATLADQLQQRGAALVFVTGRHHESVRRAISQFGLPAPHAIVCDVGSTVLRRLDPGEPGPGEFEPEHAYVDLLDALIAALPIAELRERLADISGLRLQEYAKQGRFKLSYYVQADQLERLAAEVRRRLDAWSAPYSIVHSVDPFNHDGLLDLLPVGVSKAHALEWWAAHNGLDADSVVFCGDSGNDLAALTSGFKAVVVGNADRSLARRVQAAHREAGWTDRLFLADAPATSGVLQGARWFGLADREPAESLPFGATPIAPHETHFKVWVPERHTVQVEAATESGRQRFPLTPGARGVFAGAAPIGAGDRYQYVLDGHTTRPDPVSRFQPDGVHGDSQVVDQRSFVWTDQDWTGVAKRDLVIYELHAGAFTEQGTFRAAIDRLPQLVELGVTAVELMPVAQCPGKWNWGYDGVNLYATNHNYGTPDDFKAFVDACHAAGLAVLLDVVYNHLGPEGNYLGDFGPYFTNKHHTPWGAALNFDGRRRGHVRRFIVENALYWVRDLHLDGLRLDAVHFMFDDSEVTILDEVRRAVADAEAQLGRTLHLIAESNVYDERLLAEVGGLKGYDAIWCDCLMHSIYTHASPDFQLTNRQYQGAENLREALDHGYLYATKQYVRVARGALGDPAAARQPPDRSYLPSLVTALQTHDSVGNHPEGKRLHQLTSKEYQRAAAAIMLLYPSMPLLFMGEESAVDARFPFFADFGDRRLRRAVDRGRMNEYPQHDWSGALLPSQRATFRAAKCADPALADAAMFAWYQQLLSLRKQGLAAGWLAPQHMTCDHDTRLHTFRVAYAQAGRTVTVLARLTPNDHSADPTPLPCPGELMLSSLPVESTRGDQLLLQPNHAVILES